MNESILTSIKKLLGITEEYEHFDEDILTHINSTLLILEQLGVSSAGDIFITDKSVTWSSLVSNEKDLGCLRTYIYLKVKLIFDPPLSSATIEAINRTLSELEWRINVSVDSGGE